MGDSGGAARGAFETARLRLARYRVEGHEARTRASAHATQVSAEALDVERAGVWMLRDRGRCLVCISQFQRSNRSQSGGQLLSTTESPTYMRALAERRTIATADAQHDPLTSELLEGYLRPGGIVSLLDAPIIREGRVVGVVRHEHVGTLRAWSRKDLDFASSVADMMTTIFEQIERLELETALQEQAEARQESQKMEALGRVTCAVAHDFNNVLSAVSLSLEAVEEHTELPAVDDVRALIAAGKRLTQQLLTFGRPSNGPSAASTDAAQAVTDMLPMLRTSCGSGIVVQYDRSAHDARIALDRSQFEQVLLNLCLNARDAIGYAGRVSVLLRDPTPLDESAPDCLILEVRDTGTGMDEATRTRMFEPFFTTKPTGTGLGLATVHGIVRCAGGTVRAQSEPAEGTSIFVSFPRPLGA